MSNLPRDEEKSELQWYFAIGAMMNPTSMNLREMYPKESKPGILKGWKLVFHGRGGMGDVEQDADEEFHGILHLLTAADFKVLDGIESIYSRVRVNVTCYDGTVTQAEVYQMDAAKCPSGYLDGLHNLPGERYIDIISRGAVHYGVHECYIEKLKTIPVEPRKTVEEYRILPTPPVEIYTLAELQERDGKGDNALWISINGKILRFKDDPSSSADVKKSWDWAVKRWGGRDCTVGLAKVLYEPLYPIPTDYHSMHPDSRGWAEELFVGWMSSQTSTSEPGPLDIGRYTVIGLLKGYHQADLEAALKTEHDISSL